MKVVENGVTMGRGPYRGTIGSIFGVGILAPPPGTVAKIKTMNPCTPPN